MVELKSVNSGPVPAIVTAGDRGAARSIHGESKIYLEVDGRPLVAHVVMELQRAPEISSVWVVGDREKLEAVFAREDVQRALRKPLHVLDQWDNLYENSWNTYRCLLPDAPPGGRDPKTDADRDVCVLYLSADLPFVTAQEISAFVREGLATGADYVIGLSREESLAEVGLVRGDGRADAAADALLPITFFNLREGRFKQNNLHLARPARLGNRHLIQDMYEHRKQRDLRNMLGLTWGLFRRAGSSLSVVFFFVLIHLGGVLDRHGYRAAADFVRRGPTLARVGRVISLVMQSSLAFGVPDVAGAAVDVDDEREYDTIVSHYAEWRARVERRAVAIEGEMPLPLPESAHGALDAPQGEDAKEES